MAAFIPSFVIDGIDISGGDVAFVKLKPVGTVLFSGDEVALIETIKINVVSSSSLNGKVSEVNPAMAIAPETIDRILSDRSGRFVW